MRKQRNPKKIHLVLALVTLIGVFAFGQEKEWESNVIYSEKNVPFYELPDPLVTIEGRKVNHKRSVVKRTSPTNNGHVC